MKITKFCPSKNIGNAELTQALIKVHDQMQGASTYRRHVAQELHPQPLRKRQRLNVEIHQGTDAPTL